MRRQQNGIGGSLLQRTKDALELIHTSILCTGVGLMRPSSDHDCQLCCCQLSAKGNSLLNSLIVLHTVHLVPLPPAKLYFHSSCHLGFFFFILALTLKRVLEILFVITCQPKISFSSFFLFMQYLSNNNSRWYSAQKDVYVTYTEYFFRIQPFLPVLR